jgi:hypothetical protein
LYFGPLGVVLLAGCGDRCERLCDDVSTSIGACRSDALQWSDLGARSRADFARTCKDDWSLTSQDLGARELELGLAVCRDAQIELETLTCDELVALYAP